MRAASPLVLVSAVLAEPAPESKLPATKHKSQPTRLSVSCEISLQICTAPGSLYYWPAGGCHSSTLFPSGSMTQANFPYSDSSIRFILVLMVVGLQLIP